MGEQLQDRAAIPAGLALVVDQSHLILQELLEVANVSLVSAVRSSSLIAGNKWVLQVL